MRAVILVVYMAIRGRPEGHLKAIRPGMSVVVAALLGGPDRMSGYLIANDNIGSGLTAIISTFYPALGTLLAFILLKERMASRQIAALLVARGHRRDGLVGDAGADRGRQRDPGRRRRPGLRDRLRGRDPHGACATRPWITRWPSRVRKRPRRSQSVHRRIAGVFGSRHSAGSPVGGRGGAGRLGGHRLVSLLLQGPAGASRAWP